MNVIDLLKLKAINYKDTGGDIVIGCLNPEHVDSNPSLRIHPENGSMNCFSCGFKGNIFSYLNSDNFVELPKLSSVKKQIKELQQQNTELLIPEASVMYDKDYRDIKAETYIKYSAFTVQKDFENRLVFPISNSVGQIKAFLGRSMWGDTKPKYMVKPRGVALPLFPLRYSPSIILVEGIFDMLNLEDKGIDNAVVCFGSSQITNNNVMDKFVYQMLAGTKVVFILFDNDVAGRKSAEVAEKIIREKTSLVPIVINYLLPEGEDPGSLTSEQVDSLKNNLKKVIDEQANI